MDIIEEIKKLKTLLDQGAISHEEFETLKQKVLSNKSQSIKTKPQVSSSSSTQSKLNANKNSNSSNNAIQVDGETNANGFEAGNEKTAKLLKYCLWLSLILGFVFAGRYESVIAFLIALAISVSITLVISGLIPKLNQRNFLLGVLLIFYILMVFIPIGGNTSNSSSEQTNEQPSHDADKEVRDFIISNRFVDYENGVAFTLKFSDKNYGWFGIMEMDMGSCAFFYQYETKGRSINLTFDSSNCTTQGSSTTARLNSDNSISINYRGQEFRFKPL